MPGWPFRVAESGRHVLVEKPMALTVGDCDAMIQAASANGVLLGVVSQRRLYEPVRACARRSTRVASVGRSSGP